MFNMTPWMNKRLPVRHEDEHPVHSLQKEMNRVFEEFFGSQGWHAFSELPGAGSWGDLTPRIDMSETDRELLVKVELPGMTEKEVEISIHGDILTIAGEKKQEKEQTEKGWYRMERQYGSFNRSIPLPCEVDCEKTQAQYKNGVVTVTMPKADKVKSTTKTIPVKAQ
jgi:HSP20 family protein